MGLSLAACPEGGGEPPRPASRALAAAEAGIPSICASSCSVLAGYLCAYDPARKYCVECTSDEHCAKNPGAFGDRCDTVRGICTCSGAAACAGKIPGQRCIGLQTSSLCGCQGDPDCVGSLKCIGSLFGSRYCAPGCTSDSQCISPLTPRCNTASGRCVACTSDAHCTGKLALHCSKTSGRCAACTQDSHCNASGKSRCDLRTGACQECTADSHCPGSGGQGNRCLTSTLGQRFCGCGGDGDCAGNPAGPSCDVASGRCTCAGDPACKAPNSTCADAALGSPIKRCQKPCTLDSDCGRGLKCLKHASGNRCGECLTDSDCTLKRYALCDPATRRCRACRQDSDCGGETPRCDTGSGRCVGCTTNAHCASHPAGQRCSAGLCGCASDADCSGSGAWGGSCVTFGGLLQCGCTGDGHCSGKAAGPTCETSVRKCTCARSSDCKQAPRTTCMVPYPGSRYLQCGEPCATDSDCPGRQFGRCDLRTGVCVACTRDAHCAGEEFEKLCDSTRSRCVECLKDADCTSKTLGSKCKGNTCTCSAAADCAGNVHGTVCDSDYKSCSCVKDTDCPAGSSCKPSSLGALVKLCR